MIKSPLENKYEFELPLEKEVRDRIVVDLTFLMWGSTAQIETVRNYTDEFLLTLYKQYKEGLD